MGLLSLAGRITLDGSPFQSALKGIRGSVSGLSRDLNSSLGGRVAALVSVSAIAAATKNLIEFGSQINDTALRIGVGTDELQRFVFAAKQNGAGLEDITSAFRHLAKARQEAMQNPNGPEGQAFTAAGIDAAMLKAGDLSKMFRQLGKAIQDVNFGAGEQPLVEKLLGRGGGVLIPMFVDGLHEAAAAADEVGAVLEASIIAQLDDAGDKIDEIIAKTRGPLAAALTGSVQFFLKAFTTVRDVVSGVGAGLGAWIEAFKSGELSEHPEREGGIFMDAWAENQRENDEADQIAEEAVAAKRQRKVQQRAERKLKPFQFIEPDRMPSIYSNQSDRAMSPLKDSLTSVGNFLGANPNAETKKELAEANKVLREIERNTKKGPGLQFPQ